MKTLSYLCIASVLMLSCKQQTTETKVTTTEKEDVTPEIKVTRELITDENGWATLFDGTNYDAWHMYNGGEVSDSWTIEDGAMAFIPGKGGENIVTNEDFTDFELSLEWKIAEGGNSGIFWGVQENEKFKEAYQTGPEIQVLDDERHPDAKAGTTHQAGALYDMVAPSKKVVKPAGEWNTCVLMINHKTNQGSVTLNGTKIVEFPVHGKEWEEMIANSKFNGWEGFGASKTGKIGLQDHGNKVWFRNIKIKEL
ncbi:3-keto-disaccharide hydrolase [Joostella sp. CR20]|uniref:3-keto-disaccharide hydrolase n=1 Tax=Joostella sp. CR20 TaxID=2804312 RepID=UPI00313DA66A